MLSGLLNPTSGGARVWVSAWDGATNEAAISLLMGRRMRCGGICRRRILELNRAIYGSTANVSTKWSAE